MNNNNDVDIPEDIIEQAVLHWVKLAGQANEQQQALTQQWRRQSNLHELAWLRIQSLDQDFTAIPTTHKPLAMLSNNQVDSSRRSALKLLTFVGVGAGSSALFWQQHRVNNDSVLITRRGQINQHRLTETIQLSLNTQSEIELVVNEHENTVILQQGDLVLDNSTLITGNSLPLIVKIAEKSVTFQVNGPCKFMVSKNDNCLLAVTSGQVSVTRLGKTFIAKANQQWQLNEQGDWQAIQLHYQPMAWLKGLLIADNMALGELLAYLNRYHYTLISLSNSLENLKVSGVYQLNNLESAMQALSQVLPIHINQIAKLWYRINTL
jgi:transmembrane sensor